MNRRIFLKTTSALTFTIGKPINLIPLPNLSNSVLNLKVLPRLLRRGDKIAITAPASGSNIWEIKSTVNFFKNMGCNVIVGESITKRNKKFRFLSNADNIRAREFMNFVEDPEVRAVIAARGGYGTIRILNYLDYNLISKDPKIYLGFSDITILLNAIHSKTGIITFHGPVANSRPNAFSFKILRTLLFEDEFAKAEKINYNFTPDDVISPGIAKGELVGGNLSSLITLLGTNYDFDTTNKILFFEEVSEPPYKVDRMLKQLELAGKLQELKGIIIGSMGPLDARHNFFPDYSFTLREVLVMNLSELGIPVIINFPFGHSQKFFTFPIGYQAEFNTYNYEFSLTLHNK